MAFLFSTRKTSLFLTEFLAGVTWYDMLWYGMVLYMIWYDIWYDMTWYDMIYDMIWYDMIWYMIWYMIRYYDMIHVMIYLLTAIGLTPGGSSTAYIYTQTIHRTQWKRNTQNAYNNKNT